MRWEQEELPKIALAKRPGDVDLMYYLGRASGLLSRQTFEQLRATDPESARAHQILGETYAVLHNTAATVTSTIP